MTTSLEALIWQFDQSLQSGQRLELDGVLGQVSEDRRPELLVELMAIELQHDWMAGIERFVDEYRTRFAGLIVDPGVWDSVVREEFIARRRAGGELPSGELQRRFGSRAGEFFEVWRQVRQDYSSVLQLKKNVTSPSETWIGRLVAARFEILDHVGHGAFAEVYRAFDRVLHREVAVKLTREPLADESEDAQRFFREAESIAHLQHPGIISIHEFGREGDRLYIVEEYVSHGTLERQMNRGPSTTEQAARWLQEICNAMDYAHQCGVIHRDLKPANVLLDREGRLKVGDFGLAVRRDGEMRLTSHGRLLGTPAYMSPEQVRGDCAITPATDVYALGAILYQMLTGQLPFQGSAATVLNQILHEDPKPLRQRCKAIPQDLETICLVAMAKDPQHRYGSAREMAEDLRRYMARQPLQARRTGWFGQLRLWVRRQPVLAAVSIGSAVLITLTVVGSFNRITQERDRYRAERDRANAALCDSSMSNVENELQVRASGWFERAENYFAQAARLADLPQRQLELRDLGAKLFLEPAPRFEQVACFQVPDADPVALDSVTESRAISALSIDPKSTDWVAVGTVMGDIYFWNPETGMRHLVVRMDDRVSQLQWEAASGQLWALSEDELHYWKFDEPQPGGTPVWKPTVSDKRVAESVTTFAYHAAFQSLVCGFEDGHLEIMRQTPTGFVQEQSWIGHESELVQVVFSEDGMLLASSSLDRSLKCWETRTGAMLSARLLSEPARSLNFAARGSDLLWTSWETFTLYRAAINGPIQEFGKMAFPWRSVAETSEQRVASISTDGQLVLWQGNQQIVHLRNDSEWTALTAVPELEIIGVGSATGEVQLIQVAGSKLNRRFPTRHAITIDQVGHLYDERGRLDPDEPTTRMSDFQWNDASGLVVGAKSDWVVFANQAGDVHVIRDGEVRVLERVVAGYPANLALGNHDKWLATCSDAGPVKIWNVDTLELVREIPVDVGRVIAIALQPDGDGVIVAGRSGTFLYAAEQAPFALNPHVQSSAALAWGDGRFAISQSDGQIAVHQNDRSGPPVMFGSLDPLVHALAFSPDSSILFALYQNKDVASWDVNAGRLKQKRTLDTVHDLVAVDPLGQMLVLQTKWGRSKVLDLSTLQLLAQLEHGGRWSGFSHDGDQLWIAGQGLSVLERTSLEPSIFPTKMSAAQLQDPTERILSTVPTTQIPGGHTDTVWSMDVSPNQQWMATGSFDRRVKIWDIESRELLTELRQHQEMIWRVRFSPDSRYLATGSADSEAQEGELILWRTTDWSSVAAKRIGTRLVGAIDFHPRLPWIGLATFDGLVALVHSETLESQHTAQPFRHPIVDLKFHPQGNVMAGACLGDGVGLWNVASGDLATDQPLHNPIFLKEPSERVWAIAFSGDQKLLAAGCESGAIILYDTRDWKRIATLPTGRPRLRYLRFSPDDSKIFASVFVGDGCLVELDQMRQRLQPLGLAW